MDHQDVRPEQTAPVEKADEAMCGVAIMQSDRQLEPSRKLDLLHEVGIVAVSLENFGRRKLKVHSQGQETHASDPIAPSLWRCHHDRAFPLDRASRKGKAGSHADVHRRAHLSFGVRDERVLCEKLLMQVTPERAASMQAKRTT